jgi:hypothetical protein
MDCKYLADYLTVGITFLGVIVAIISFYIALKQYNNINRFKKGEYFLNLRNKFRENADFNFIRQRIELNENIPENYIIHLYTYIGFFEDLQIAINSKFIDKKMVCYLFGYYIINCDNYIRNNNEIDIDLDLPLWAAFNELKMTMQNLLAPNIYNNDLQF